MYVQCNKVRIRFSRRQASFRERAQLSILQRLQWLTADDENRLALTAQPRNRLGLIVKIDADLKRTVWNIKGLGDVFLERLDSMLRRQPLSAITGMLSAIDRNHCPPSNGMPVRHQRNTHWWSGVDLLHKNRN